MAGTATIRRAGLGAGVLATLLALFALSAPATRASSAPATQASAVDYCPYIPIIRYGIPPWGFHTGQPISGATGSYARGHGNINLAANTVSGVICKVDRVPGDADRTIVLSVLHHLGYHSHYARMWGYPGNIMHITVRVTRSINGHCPVGTIGHATLFASYNNVRSDSVQFFFPAACRSQNHLYHGPQVNNQVPPA